MKKSNRKNRATQNITLDWDNTKNKKKMLSKY